MEEQVVHARKGKSVLVIEDNADVRASLVMLLNTLGYETYEAEDGPAALAVFEVFPNINLLLADVVLPGGMNGLDLAHEARRRNETIGVVLISGYPKERLTKDGKFDEEFDLLEKPYTLDELEERLRAAMEG